MYVEYSSNNSGGSWWLTDDDWRALEAAGWIVQWCGLSPKYTEKDCERDPETGVPILVPESENNSGFPGLRGKGDRWLGALATTAYRPGLSLRDAVNEWERVTGQNSTDAGCPCCGIPHNFTEYDSKGEFVDSGPEADYSASW